MGWIYLAISIFFETAWALTLKPTAGYTKLWPVMINFTIAICGIITLSKAMKTIPTNVGYAAWVGVSLVLITLSGHFLYNEPLQGAKVVFFGFIFLGVVGLKWAN